MLFNARTNEPFLRLPPPHSNIILTPPRQSDAEAIVSLLNDERVCIWLEGPPYPYHIEHAREWLAKITNDAQCILQELQEHPGRLVGGCPMRILRELNEDGEEIHAYLGECAIIRYEWHEISEAATRERVKQENAAKAVGDPEIVWTIGDYLAPSHHGKGIMTATIKTIIDEWMLPRMGVKKIKACALQHNTGSLRVFEKNGFVLDKILDDWTIKESKGGGGAVLHVLSRQL